VRAFGRARLLTVLAVVGLIPAVGAAQARPLPARDDLWQITLKDGTIVWNLHLVRLERYQLTLLDLAQRRAVVAQLLARKRTPSP
jgi:hypothetical protein